MKLMFKRICAYWNTIPTPVVSHMETKQLDDPLYNYSNHECDSKGKRLNLFHSVDCNLVVPCEIKMIACQNSIKQALSQPDSWS